MSRPLGLFLRPSRRPWPRIRPCRRSYTLTPQNQQAATTGQAAEENRSDVPPSKAKDTNLSFRRIFLDDRVEAPFKRTPFHEPEPPEGGVPEGIKVQVSYLQIELQGPHGLFRRDVDFATLRDACSCERCVDPHSKQRIFRTSDIPSTIAPKSLKWDGKELVVQWEDDIPGFDASHTSTYNARFLSSPARYSVGDVSPSRTRIRWNGKEMQQQQHWISYEDYMNDEAKFAGAMRKLALLGLIFIKDIPDSREMVERIATRMGPLRSSFYGPTWDVRTVPEAKNVAYTNQFLGFHMDLMYMKDPPGFQLLHCLKNSCDGGESLFSDAYAAAIRLHNNDKSSALFLQDFEVNYEYVHEDQIYHNSWPVIESVSKGGKVSGIRHINYSPPFQGALRPKGNIAKWAPLFRRFRESLAAFTRELEHESSIFELKLNPGECVIFENRRVVHARRGFNTSSGERWLAGAYVDEDAVLSRFRVCKEKQPVAWKGARPRRPSASKADHWAVVA